VLRRAGGTGNEPIEMLLTAMLPPPAPTRAMAIAQDIEARRGPRPKYPLTQAQQDIVAQAADDALRYCQAREYWFACQQFNVLAEEVARRTKKLRHVNGVGLRLLTATDEDLHEEAKLKVAMNRGRLFVHPRDMDAGSLRRRLRLSVGRAAIHAAGVLGLVGGPSELHLPRYADNWTTDRFRAQQQANRQFLGHRVAVSAKTGDKIPLAAIADSATVSRRSLWYALILGMRQIAHRDGMIAFFGSVTLPTQWHLHPQFGDSGDPRNSPDAGAREIARRWHSALAMFRRRCNRRDGRVIGIRVAEPHSDGTVHLHFVCWITPNRFGDFCTCIGRHFPATTDDEKENQRSGNFERGPAVVIKKWNPRDAAEGNADAASYALTYVWSVLADRDATVDSDSQEALPGREAESRNTKDYDAERVAAWARHIRIRRISLIGLARGTVTRWQAIHRLMRGEDRTGRLIEEPRARIIARAMRKRQWGTALRLIGGLSKPNTPRLAALREERINVWGDTTTATVGFYHPRTGQICAEKVRGEWRIERKGLDKTPELLVVSIIHSYPRGDMSPSGGGARSTGPPP
jgi:hypothetical protein